MKGSEKNEWVRAVSNEKDERNDGKKERLKGYRGKGEEERGSDGKHKVAKGHIDGKDKRSHLSLFPIKVGNNSCDVK